MVGDFVSRVVVGSVTTGVSLGMLYVLLFRFLKADRASLDRKLEAVRLRLDAGPVPVLELGSTLITLVLGVIYGETWKRRLVASAVIGVVVTAATFGILYFTYRTVPDEVQREKARLECMAGNGGGKGSGNGGGRPANGPSTTGNPSGGGRGNNPAR